jgi:hypothetical protein
MASDGRDTGVTSATCGVWPGCLQQHLVQGEHAASVLHWAGSLAVRGSMGWSATERRSDVLARESAVARVAQSGCMLQLVASLLGRCAHPAGLRVLMRFSVSASNPLRTQASASWSQLVEPGWCSHGLLCCGFGK